MDKTYKVLKKFGEFKKGEVFDPQAGYEGTEEDIVAAIKEGFIAEIDESDDNKPAKGEKVAKRTSVTVSTNHREPREFSLAVHGENFEALAKSFADQYPEAVIA